MILITGGNGQLAKSLRKIITDGVTMSKAQLDITNLDQLDQFFRENRPIVTINCAAYTNVEESEDKKELALKVNSEGPSNLAKVCQAYNCKLIHISTDYVFGGNCIAPISEDIKPYPQNHYGFSKLCGEEEIKKYCSNYLILRTSWLYSEFSGNFVSNMNKLLKSKDRLNVVCDQFGSPTHTGDLALAINKALSMDIQNETFHISNRGSCSWYDLTMVIKNFFKYNCDVQPILSSEYPQKAKRPNFSVLSQRKFESIAQFEMPFWQTSLIECLKSKSFDN